MSLLSIDFIHRGLINLRIAEESFKKADYNDELYRVTRVIEDMNKALEYLNREIEYKE